ncbi:MAG: YrhA family protein, partial [Paracoccaceae bacterium]
MTPENIPSLLTRIHPDQRRAGEAIRPPATDAAIADLAARTQATFALTLPEDYAAFLRHSDGLVYNGLVLYDCGSTAHPHAQALIDANHIWRE